MLGYESGVYVDGGGAPAHEHRSGAPSEVNAAIPLGRVGEPAHERFDPRGIR